MLEINWTREELNRPGFAGDRWFKLCGHGLRVQRGVVALFGFGWRDIPDGFHKASVIEPVYPLELGELHGFEVAP